MKARTQHSLIIKEPFTRKPSPKMIEAIRALARIDAIRMISLNTAES